MSIVFDDTIFGAAKNRIQILKVRGGTKHSTNIILRIFQSLLGSKLELDRKASDQFLHLNVISSHSHENDLKSRYTQHITTCTIIQKPPHTVIIIPVIFNNPMERQDCLKEAELMLFYDSRPIDIKETAHPLRNKSIFRTHQDS